MALVPAYITSDIYIKRLFLPEVWACSDSLALWATKKEGYVKYTTEKIFFYII